ncbi:MAG: class I SAM-dependent methyltransferase [Haloferula sp.]
MSDQPQHRICDHYEACFQKHGDTPQGVDWPNEQDAITRYRVMLDVARLKPREETASLLDFGCGTGALLDYMQRHEIEGFSYSGLDLSRAFVEAARHKHPSNDFYQLDILENPDTIPQFDYVIMNGVFTEKLGISYEAMLAAVFSKCRVGMAFNVMSKHVDWEREDLFHVPFDTMAALLKARLTRHVSFRFDYGLYEYTVYAYHHPTIPPLT